MLLYSWVVETSILPNWSVGFPLQKITYSFLVGLATLELDDSFLVMLVVSYKPILEVSFILFFFLW